MALRSLGLAAAAMLAVVTTASAKDPVAGDGGPRTPADWCCIEATQLPPIETGSALDSPGLAHAHIAPVGEAKPGLDGADWNCRRPDGSQRCVSELLTHR
jgi:hypothetical protein